MEAALSQGAECDAVDRAVSQARAEGLQFRYPIKKLRRVNPSRKLGFNVVRSIHRGGESWFLGVGDRAGQRCETFLIKEETYYLRAANGIPKSRWRGDTFLLTDAGEESNFRNHPSCC